jgi:uncharacterized protein
MKNIRREVIKLLTFLLGVILIGFGVTLMNKSGLGLGPWNVTDANLERWIGVTLGQSSIIHTFVIITLVAILNKNLKYYLSLITTMCVALSIDVWNYEIFATLIPQHLGEQIAFEVIGFLGITIGLAFIIITRYPAMVFDELTLTLNRMFKRISFSTIRMGIEFFGLFLALIYGVLGGFGFGELGINPIILAFCFGPAIQFFKLRFERLIVWETM